jgi:uncharacterized protein YndB with AHSA1/START domain
MAVNLIAKSTVNIDAPANTVWDALTNPKLIKQYLFGTEAISDWKVGSPIEFKGTWEGKEYLDKGKILRIVPQKLFQYTYFSSMAGKPDSPENYANVSYELDEDEGTTTLTIKQENIDNEKSREHSEKNWSMVLDTLKKLLEKK